MINSNEKKCYAGKAISVVGGKWKLLILCALHEGTFRFGELKRKVSGITTKMLTQQLRELEADGLVIREIFLETPPRVEYSLTELGYSFREVLLALSNWGSKIQERKTAIERLAS